MSKKKAAKPKPTDVQKTILGELRVDVVDSGARLGLSRRGLSWQVASGRDPQQRPYVVYFTGTDEMLIVREGLPSLRVTLESLIRAALLAEEGT